MPCSQYKACCAASPEIRELVLGNRLPARWAGVGEGFGIGRCGSFNERTKNTVDGRKGKERFS